MTKKYLNGELVDLTTEEETEYNNNNTEWENSKFDRTLSNLRLQRNRLLAETDWMANSDVTMSTEMETYRQDLRDLTNGLTTVEQVDAVTWPTKPGA